MPVRRKNVDVLNMNKINFVQHGSDVVAELKSKSLEKINLVDLLVQSHENMFGLFSESDKPEDMLYRYGMAPIDELTRRSQLDLLKDEYEKFVQRSTRANGFVYLSARMYELLCYYLVDPLFVSMLNIK